MNISQLESDSALKEFIHHFNLKDKHSRIIFFANVGICTAKHEIELTATKIRVSFNVYGSLGKLFIDNANIDPYIFPEEFDLDWQKFEFIDEEYLKISGEHNQNKEIGKYSVIIHPINS